MVRVVVHVKTMRMHNVKDHNNLKFCLWVRKIIYNILNVRGEWTKIMMPYDKTQY